MDPYTQLESMDDRQDRIDAVAADLNAGERRFAVIEAWDLASLLGAYFEDVDDDTTWNYLYLARPMALEDGGFTFPCAENLELLEGRLPAARYEELAALAKAMDLEGPGEDLPLTPEERSLLDRAYAREHAEDGPTFCLARRVLEASDGTELWFEALVEYGEAEDPKGPYDRAEFINIGDYLEIE